MDSNAKKMTANDECQGQSTSAFAGLHCEQDNSISNTVSAFMERSSGNLYLELQEEQNLHMFTKADAMKNCQKWLETQTNVASDSESSEPRYPKRKRNQSLSLEEETSAFDVNNEFEEAESVVSSSNSGAKGQRKTKKLKDKQLDLNCEWKNCNYSTEDMESFVKHVSEHVPEVGVNQDEGMYLCLWESCDFETTDSKEITRHVNFHSYHTKIKCIGSNMITRLNLPPCSYDHIGRNFLPDLPDVFSCDWDDCERTFNNSQLYFYHVHAHTKGMPRGHFVVGGVNCKWRGCKAVFRTAYKLIDHIRSHTQEKVVGCPTCGGLFASKAKLFDHCKRQLPLELKGYQCSHCSKYYPSERLLRDHMRHHVNHYKCSFCDMTCTNPSSLACHIRYRHLNIKPFKCNFCDYMSKTQHDMNYHLNTHCSDALYDCEEEDCDFSCRSAYGLSKHYRNYHRNEDEPLYCCHICDERFHRGSSLTKHLFNRHSFRWPSGHSRFRYKQDEDGFYRLQTVRYESLEVTQEIMQSESGTTPQEVRGQYSIYQVSGRKDGVPVFHILEEEEEDDPDPQESHSKTPGKIIISLEEVDTEGNVIQRKEMETEEIPSLPPGDVKVIEAAPSIETS